MDEKTLNALVNAIKNKDPKGLKAYENLLKIASSKPKNEKEQKNIEAAKEYVTEIKKRLTAKAAHGAKLDYVKSLKHICPEGLEPYYYKKGGNLECGCKGRKMEEGAKVEKAETGTVAKFKQSKKLPQLQTVNPSDTVHVKGIAYSLTNMNGSRVDNRFPAYDGKVEKEDRAKAQAGDKDAKKRLEKAEMVTAPKKGTKLTTVEKFKSAKCGSKMKKHKLGGSLNGIPFYQGGTSEGGILSMAELIPIYGTYKSGLRFFRNPSWRTAGEFAISGLADAAMLTGIGLGAGTALKAGNMAVKAGKVAKAASNLKKVKAARNLKYGQPYEISGYYDDAARTASNLASDALTYGTDYSKAIQQGNRLIDLANWADGAANAYNTAKWMGESALSTGATGALVRKNSK